MMQTNGFILDHFTVSQPLSEWLWSVTGGMHPHTRQLFFHVVASTVVGFRRDYSRWVPVSWALRQRKISRARWADLVERGLLENSDYSIKEKRSMEFRVSEGVWNKIVSFYLNDNDDDDRAYFDLFKNRPLKRFAVTKTYRQHPTWRAAMGTVGRVFFNEARYKAGLRWRQEQVRKLEDEIAESAAPSEELKSRYNRALGRYLNDKNCLKAVRCQQYRKEAGGFASYIPAYECSNTGRATGLGGALQSCTKFAKFWVYSGLEDFYDVRNGDLVNSQVLGGIEEFKEAEIFDGLTYLRAYRDLPNNKEVYAALAGVSVDCWKKVFLGMLMGGSLPKDMRSRNRKKKNFGKFRYSKYGRGKIHKVIMDEALRSERDPEDVLAGLRAVLSPLEDALDRWHYWLITQIPNRKKTRGRGGAYLENMMGAKIYLHELSFAPHKIWRTKSRLAAFYLQGREAFFTLTLMALGPEYGFQTLSNEHDGLVTNGEIPEEAWRRAGALAGFEGENWSFIEKPFKETEDE